MVFKLPKPKRRVNEKMTLEALHKSAETYREMYDDIRRKKDILQKQLDIAIDTLKVYAEVDNWYNIYKQNIFDETPVAFKQKWKTEKGYKPALDCLKKILKIMQELANGEK